MCPHLFQERWLAKLEEMRSRMVGIAKGPVSGEVDVRQGAGTQILQEVIQAQGADMALAIVEDGDVSDCVGRQVVCRRCLVLGP